MGAVRLFVSALTDRIRLELNRMIILYLKVFFQCVLTLKVHPASVLVVGLTFLSTVIFPILPWGSRHKNFILNDSMFETPLNELNNTYDFIIVGGGIAGCTLAYQLSKNFSTLLVHGPGGVPNVLTRVPMFHILNLGYSDMDFLYRSTRLADDVRWIDHSLVYNSGKPLGGSMVLSAYIYSIIKPADMKLNYLDYRTLKRYTRSMERQNFEKNISNYGTDGILPLTQPDVPKAFARYHNRFLSAGAKITGTSIIEDHNDVHLGFGRLITAVERNLGYPAHGARVFFEPFLTKMNGRYQKMNGQLKLHIVLRSMVSKILIEKEGDRLVAKGVIFKYHGENERRIYATRKVIISAGAIRTPQLLMLSGIGPKDKLADIGVPVVKELEGVGKNLHDHYDIGTAMHCFYHKDYADIPMTDFMNYFKTGKGFFRAPAAVTAAGFFASKNKNLTTCPDTSDPVTCRPDFELILSSIGVNTQIVSSTLMSAGATQKQVRRDFYASNTGLKDTLFRQKECLLLTPTLLHAKNRGEIIIKDSNIETKPIISLNTTDNVRDMELFGELFLTTRNITKMAFKDGDFTDVRFPDCEEIKKTEGMSIRYGTCMARKYIKTAWHMSGTAKMGDKNDRMAVVDECFDVMGVDNLSVVDGSTFPSTTSGHMIATIFSHALVAADMFTRGCDTVQQEIVRLREETKS